MADSIGFSLIEGFENYGVTTTGEVWSFLSGKYLKKISQSTGYYHVALQATGLPDLKQCSIHRLVARAFIKNEGNKPVVNHLDGNKKNNNVENLEWSTCSENMYHAYKTGIVKGPLGVRNVHAKLTEKQVLEIREKRNTLKIRVKDLAKEYNISRQMVTLISKKKNWAHL